MFRYILMKIWKFQVFYIFFEILPKSTRINCLSVSEHFFQKYFKSYLGLVPDFGLFWMFRSILINPLITLSSEIATTPLKEDRLVFRKNVSKIQNDHSPSSEGFGCPAFDSVPTQKSLQFPAQVI